NNINIIKDEIFTLDYDKMKIIDFKIEMDSKSKLGLEEFKFVTKARDTIEILVNQIVHNKLISNKQLFSDILYNEKIAWVKNKDDTKYGYLVQEESKRDYFRISNENTHMYADNAPTYKINGITYRLLTKVATPSKPKLEVEKPRNSSLDSTGVLYRIVYYFYESYLKNLEGYNSENNCEYDILYKLVKAEFNEFNKNIHSKEYSTKANEDNFRKVKECIEKLTFIWSEPNSIIDNGNQIKIKGVYRMSNIDYINLMDNLEVRQMILQGPPGTSKTYTAKEMIKEQHNIKEEDLEYYMIRDYENEFRTIEDNENKEQRQFGWDIVQFHPSYGYEDFIRGISVGTNDKGDVIYNTVNKILGSMSNLARRDENKDKKFYLIIDEINRANIATVFGELIYALEYRDKEVATPYKIEKDYNIKIPENLYIIGTMNTADKSVGGIDYAIRRRFLFISSPPKIEVIDEFYKKEKDEKIGQIAINLFKNIKELFIKYKSDDYHLEDIQIGHTYFLIKGVEKEKKLKQRFIYQMLPILKEYYKDGLFKSYDSSSDSKYIDQLMLLIMNKLEELKKYEDIKNKLAKYKNEENEEDIITEYIFEKLVSDSNIKVVKDNG
ncbi:McrB family protein, partial [Romboutsia sp.]|uniref:McrB family protein n=1 Tax=Romboutsia sp. TaxID=1965302 RepID=UPI003F3A4C9C